MASVTRRIKQIKQPYGGYIKPKQFSVTTLQSDVVLYPQENIAPSLVGLAVDYLTRFMMGTDKIDAFYVSALGARNAEELDNAAKLLEGVKGLGDNSIINACKLVGYDGCFRAGMVAYMNVETIQPDKETIENIRTMVKRSISFFESYGPITKDGFTFEGGYTEEVSSGDGDFLTEDTLWDFKVSKYGISNAHTLQLLMYYLMGQHSVHTEFDTIEKLGVFNPRLNTVSLLDISAISEETIQNVSRDVIGYLV